VCSLFLSAFRPPSHRTRGRMPRSFFRQARDVRSLITVRGHRLGVRLCVSLGSLFLVAKISGPCHVQRRWPCPSPPELLAALLYLSPQSLSSLSLPWKCYGDSVRQGGHRPGGLPSSWQWLSRRSGMYESGPSRKLDKCASAEYSMSVQDDSTIKSEILPKKIDMNTSQFSIRQAKHVPNDLSAAWLDTRFFWTFNSFFSGLIPLRHRFSPSR
jgi:hypothetical protein